MLLRLLSAKEVRHALPMPQAIDAMRAAFLEEANGTAKVPLRTALHTEEGVSLFMPAYLSASHGLAQKIVSVYPQNATRGLPVIGGVVIVLDAVTGRPSAILDGGALTAIRTGAGAGLATDLLARSDSKVLTMFGAGAQAYDQILAVRCVRDISEVRIISRSGVSSVALAQRLRSEGVQATSFSDVSAALQGADIISCATTSREPIFRDVDLADGSHLNLVGAFTPEMQEAPPETVQRALVVVDQVEAALAEAGDLIKPLQAGLIDRSHLEITLGDLLLHRRSGRSENTQITIFKSVGLAAQDVAAALEALAQAEQSAIGTLVDLGG